MSNRNFFVLLLMIVIGFASTNHHLHEIGCANGVERLCHLHWW